MGAQCPSDGLKEYDGPAMAATRFGDQTAEDDERLLGSIDLYDAMTEASRV